MTSSKPRTIDTFTTDWQGITLSVTYEANWLNMKRNLTAHLQIEAISPKRAILPVTETGYRSYFTPAVDIDAAGGPVAYALAWLDHAATSKSWLKHVEVERQRQETDKQFSLF